MLMNTNDNNPQNFFTLANEQYQFILQTLGDSQSRQWEHGEIEQWLQYTGTELLRRLYQCHLDLRAGVEKVETKVIGSEGEVRPHRRKAGHRRSARRSVVQRIVLD